jgi:hypothetical protein
MSSDLDLFYEDFMQEILLDAAAGGNFNEPNFTEKICEFLEEEGYFSDYYVISYKKDTKGLKVDAWSYNDETCVLNLVVSSFNDDATGITTLNNADLEKVFKRTEKFFKESLDARFYQKMDGAISAYYLAKQIHESSEIIKKIKFTVITNQQLSSRIKSIEKLEFLGYSSQRDVCDIERIYRGTATEEKEPLVFDFKEKPLPILPAHTGEGSFQSYLLALPGELLASLYGDYGDRLLEQNVRTFLQFRGKVNKGLKKTIISYPEMFFAYNNGITATAESVDIVEINGRHELHSITNLQIVNGGQTTASLYTTSVQDKKDTNLEKIFVQMKLTIIEPESELDADINDARDHTSKLKSSAIISNISEFSNTQNKVNAADLSSNHEFHVEIEKISRRLWAPAKESTPHTSRWFYERLRGQFNNSQSNLSPASKRKFLIENPRPQLLVKTDLAKIIHSWEKLPQLVSYGAQKNFVWFIEGYKKYQLIGVQKDWDKDQSIFNEDYYKDLVVKAILFRGLDKLIMKQSWYDGYKANIVTYSIAKFRDIIDSTGKTLDFDSIWKLQETPIAITNLLLEIADEVNTCIRNTPPGLGNITEYCKRDSCLESVLQLEINYDLERINRHLASIETNIIRQADAKKKQKLTGSIDMQTDIVNIGANYWKEVLLWGQEKGLLSEKDISILEIACMIPRKIPTVPQCKAIVDIEVKIEEEGFVSKSS